MPTVPLDPALLTRPAAELAALVRSGEIAAADLVRAATDRIAELDPEVNAFVDVWAQDAIAAAERIEPGDPRPLAGVPVAIKNNRAVAGRRLTVGAEMTGDTVAPYDHNVTARLAAAGAIAVGSTTLPEWGILPVSHARRFGPTHNPWARGRTPGGSSGGSAAAVAAGMVPIAHGNDGGGSTRIPAAACGLVGLKPQRGRISLAPEIGDSFLVGDGLLTRTVHDTAVGLDVLAGPVLGDASWAPPTGAPFAELARRDPGRLRIAVTTTPPLECDLDPVCGGAARRAGELLAGLGHEVVEVDDAPWAIPGMLDAFSAVFGPLVAMQIRVTAMGLGREPVADDMEALSWAIWQRAQQLDGVSAHLAVARCQAVGRQIVAWAAGYDAVVTPALAEAPLRFAELDPDGPDPMGTFARSGRFTPYTAVQNVTGSPAISLPLFTRPDDDPLAGVPVGVQVIGQPAGEGALLALAAQLEAAEPWAARLSPLARRPATP